MSGEIQAPIGFRARIRELLSKESVALVPITERNLQRFDATLTDLDHRSKTEDGFLNINLQPTESNAEWASSVKALWVFGSKEANLAVPEQAIGFVNVYEPEHLDKVNEMLAVLHKRPYDAGALVEFASYAKDYPQNLTAEVSATKQALARVFMDEQFKDARAATVWVTHEAGNVLDPQQERALKGLGAVKLGALRYAPQETVDSTGFVIPRKAFLDTLTAPTK